MTSEAENPPAFPLMERGPHCNEGMTLRDYFAGQALANATICTGHAPDWQLQKWFGGRCGLMSWEIASRQALAYADAMLATRQKGQADAD